MENRTDQDSTRHVGDRVAPATTPDKDAIAEDRKALENDHGADRQPTPEEEAVAERVSAEAPDVSEEYGEMLERGARQEGEGKPGL